MTRSEVGDYLDRFKLRRRHCEALERAGLPWVRFHDLRHALGTRGDRQARAVRGAGLHGHQHYPTTQRYLHHKPRREDIQAGA